MEAEGRRWVEAQDTSTFVACEIRWTWSRESREQEMQWKMSLDMSLLGMRGTQVEILATVTQGRGAPGKEAGVAGVKLRVLSLCIWATNLSKQQI